MGFVNLWKLQWKTLPERDLKKIICPCVDCGNDKRQTVDEVQCHLIRRGFTKKYTNWYWHGEDRVDDDVATSVSVSERINVNNVGSTQFGGNENLENIENFDEFLNKIEPIFDKFFRQDI